MTSIKLTVTGAQAWAEVSGPLTSGMVGLPVTIEYDGAWEGLTKNLVCRCSPWGADGGAHRSILNVGTSAVVAHEVMQAGMYLYLGVEGFSPEGELVMPTTWAMCGPILQGANTGSDLSADPQLPVWSQLQAEMKQLEENRITPAQISALHGMYRVCLFDDSKDVSGAISAFEAAFGITDGGEAPDEPDVPVVPTYTVAYELINVSSDNRTATVTEGATYIATLTAAEGYTMDGAPISVTMGGVDITADVYADGVVSIPAVTGDIAIIVSGVQVEQEVEAVLPEDGLMAYFDLRNLGDKANVAVGTTKGVLATQGSGALYSWAAEPITSSDEYGAKTNRGMMFSAEGNTTQTDLGTEFTVISFGYGECIGPGISATNLQPRWQLKPAYNKTDGYADATITTAKELNADDMADYNYAVYRVSGANLTIINDTSRKDYNGNDYEGFVSWDSKPTMGRTAFGAGYGTAVAIYNRALSDVEIEEARAFMKTLEVTA